MNKKTLLFIWAFVSYVSFIIAVPWYFLYGTNTLRYLGLFGTISSTVCVITFAIKAGKKSLRAFSEKPISLTTINELMTDVTARILFSFYKSAKTREINRGLLVSCCIIALIASILLILIAITTVALLIANGIYHAFNPTWGGTK